MMKIQPFGVALLACCIVFAAIPVQPAATLLENDQVKITRALEQPHIKGKFHQHKLNRVMVYLQSGKQRFEYQGGKAAEIFDWRAGEAKWSPADGMHSPEVVSDQPFDIIEVELRQPGSSRSIPPELDPLKIDPQDYKLELENEQVRVFRATVPPHGKTPMHRHALNRINVFLTDQDFRATDSTGKVTPVKHKVGEVVWGTPVTHWEENLSDQPFEVITIELKS